MAIPRPQFLARRALAVAAALLAGCALALSARAERLADVRVRDRTLGTELAVHWHRGRPYVVGRPGDEYEVIVRNRTGEDLLAVVSVDGVNVVTGQSASPDQGGYVVGPWQRAVIRGWRKSLEETAAFYFTRLGDSYAARTGRPGDVGVIGVAVFRRARPAFVAPGPWREREGKRESNAAAPQAKRFGPEAPLGTGHGRREASPARRAEFERASAQPEQLVSLRYDSYRHLVARGVLPRGPRYGRRDPDPFPGGFVPDPR